MSTEKLTERAIAICPYAKRCPESHKPTPLGMCIVCHHAIKLARAELEKAAQIAEEMTNIERQAWPKSMTGIEIAAEIRKLLE